MGEDCSTHRTYFMQEMIKQNILFQGVFIPCYDHKKEELDFFINGFEKVIKVYVEAFNKNMILKNLIGEATKPVFRKIL